MKTRNMDQDLNWIRRAGSLCLVFYGIEQAIRPPHKLWAILWSAAGIVSFFTPSDVTEDFAHTKTSTVRMVLFWLVVLTSGVLLWYVVRAR